MLVWGGYGDGATAWNSGGRYDPKTDSWRPMSESGFLEARVLPVFAWTGKELLVWGGITPDLKRTFGDGARYDPATDRWSPMKRDANAPAVWGSKAVWTGSEMIVWGGSLRNGDDEINQVTRHGAVFDPVKDAWRPMSIEGAPARPLLSRCGLDRHAPDCLGRRGSRRRRQSPQALRRRSPI